MVKNRESNIKLMGTQIDLNREESTHDQYNKLLKENSDENDLKILFIFNIKNKTIPKEIYTYDIDVQIVIDNFRLKYYLTWTQRSDSCDKYKKLFDNLDKKALTHITIPKDLKLEAFRHYYETNENYLESYKEIWKAFLSRNIYDMRIEAFIEENWLLDMILDFCSTQNDSSHGQSINDLELNLSNQDDPIKFFKALDKNYMIKTLKLNTSKSLSKPEKTLLVANNFRRQRICTEITLNTKCGKFKCADNKNFEVYYPDYA